MPSESLQDTLEARAIKQRALVPKAAVAGTNASPQFTLGMVPNTYSVPERLNLGGWTNTDTGNVFIAQPANLSQANVIAHEAFHARQVPTGGMPAPNTYMQLEARDALAQNMRALQPPADMAGPYWGLNPNRSAEEQIANLRGYEGSLPAGTSIETSPIAEKLFKQLPSLAVGGRTDTQGMKDYYFYHSALPYQGVWGGQVQERSYMDRILSAARTLAMQHLGMNFQPPQPLTPPAVERIPANQLTR